MEKQISAFVAMPYEPRFARVYNEGIVPIQTALADITIYLQRADNKDSGQDLLWLHIDNLISNCDFIIADITGSNPNVLLELGLGLALRRIPIIITQDKDVVTNLKGHHWLQYSENDLARLGVALISRIRSSLLDILSGASQVQPIGPGRTYWWKETPPEHRPILPIEAAQLRESGDKSKLDDDLESARDYYSSAIEAASNRGVQYWEAKYDLAMILSRLKFDLHAQSLAEEVVCEAEEAKDFEYACKAHNLLSGIHLRAGRNSEALAQIRLAYEFSHHPSQIIDGPPHIVPIKNRILLEFQVGDHSAVRELIEEARAHPQYEKVRAELASELGGVDQ